METVAGVFRSIEAARRGAAQLRRSGFSVDQINLLLPGATEEQIHSVPTSETEQPGMGGAMGGVVGAALGMAGGFELGIAATALIPGVGPVLAVGLAAAAVLGVGGAIGGAALGEAAETRSTEGVPADEVFFYEDALRQGKSLLILLARNDEEAQRTREILAQAGAESLDAAREAWWIGLRDAEKEHYQALGENFAKDHDAYRAGFEAGLRRECRGKTVDDARECMRDVYPDIWESKAFVCGFRRGVAHREQVEADAARSGFLAR
jgi:hypothetical protein